MKKFLVVVLLSLLAIGGFYAFSLYNATGTSLKVGDVAPQFVAPAAKGGERFNVDLKQYLAQGPVVIYFFPKAFTKGCTLESRAFAEAMPQFEAAGASVIGMSGDDIDTLARFSTEECRSAFPVASASNSLMQEYKVALKDGMSNRTSYVIATDGRIAFVHNAMDFKDHVGGTLAAVQRLQQAKPGSVATPEPAKAPAPTPAPAAH